MSAGSRRRLGHLVTGAAALLLAGGATTLGIGIWSAQNPGPPPGSSAIAAPAPTSAPSVAAPAPSPTASPDRPAVIPMVRSVPTRIRIPAIGVDSSLMQLGLNSDGTLQVPPYDEHAPAGWYRGSPAPGQLGPSVILGHVDTFKAGPVVFYRLAQTRPGDTITISRRDGTTATFTTDRVENVPKAHFPRLEVYGDTARAELRLITCGGDWNPAEHDYSDNTVVFAHLTATT